jgi:DNA-directed RNA polymerase specialized sigma24 family protein
MPLSEDRRRADTWTGPTAPPARDRAHQRDLGGACKWIAGLQRLRDVDHERCEFINFYETSRDACLRAVIAAVGDRALAEDLVAEAFARAWTSWGKVSRYAAPQGWVVRTALNTGVSWWRPRRREIPLADHDAPIAVDPGDGVDPAVVTALRRLPTRQREVIALRIFLDLDTNTTAELLGIAPGTVTAHLSRAATALRLEPALRNRSDRTHTHITSMEVTSE